jgi:hypothetical protein
VGFNYLKAYLDLLGKTGCESFFGLVGKLSM